MKRICLVLSATAALVLSTGCDNPADNEVWPDGAALYVGSNFPDTALSWSPGGSILLFTTFGYNSLCLHGFDGVDNPVAITSSGMNESAGPNGCWNATALRIAYTAWAGDSIAQVRTIPGNVGAIHMVLNDGLLHLHPSWNPDGDSLVMSTFADGYWGLWKGDASDDSSFVPLYQPAADCLRPSYSQDGNWILFQYAQAGSSDIWLIRPDGSDAHAAVSSSFDDIHPCWGPNSEWFAFASNSDGDYEVWISNLDGSSLIRVTDDPGTDIYPAWNPGGYGWFAFSSDRAGGAGNYDIFSIPTPPLP
jgi:Tol biopolymer transport system component